MIPRYIKNQLHLLFIFQITTINNKQLFQDNTTGFHYEDLGEVPQKLADFIGNKFSVWKDELRKTHQIRRKSQNLEEVFIIDDIGVIEELKSLIVDMDVDIVIPAEVQESAMKDVRQYHEEVFPPTDKQLEIDFKQPSYSCLIWSSTMCRQPFCLHLPRHYHLQQN